MMLPAGLLADRYDRRALMLAASATGGRALRQPGPRRLARRADGPPPGGGRAADRRRPGRLPARPDGRHPDRRPRPRTCPPRSARTRHGSTSRPCSAGPWAALLYAVRSWAPFLVDSLSYGVSCFTLSRIRTDLRPQPREGAPTRPMEQVKEGYRFIRQQPFFRTLMVWSATEQPGRQRLLLRGDDAAVRAGLQPAQIGLVSTSAGLGGILGALAAPYVIERMPDRHPDRRRRLDVRPAAGAAGVVVDALAAASRSSSSCCSTRPATRASAPTARR